MPNVQFDWEVLVVQVAKEYGVKVKNMELAGLCIDGILDPPDGRKWPKTWRQRDKRLRDKLCDMEQEYWDALGCIKELPVDDMNVWNKFVKMPIAARLRVIGRQVKLVPVVKGGRYFWDFLVLCMIKGKIDMTSVVVETANIGNIDYVVPKWSWRCLQNSGGREDKVDVNISSGIDVVEDG